MRPCGARMTARRRRFQAPCARWRGQLRCAQPAPRASRSVRDFSAPYAGRCALRTAIASETDMHVWGRSASRLSEWPLGVQHGLAHALHDFGWFDPFSLKLVVEVLLSLRCAVHLEELRPGSQSRCRKTRNPDRSATLS